MWETNQLQLPTVTLESCQPGDGSEGGTIAALWRQRHVNRRPLSSAVIPTWKRSGFFLSWAILPWKTIVVSTCLKNDTHLDCYICRSEGRLFVLSASSWEHLQTDLSNLHSRNLTYQEMMGFQLGISFQIFILGGV